MNSNSFCGLGQAKIRILVRKRWKILRDRDMEFLLHLIKDRENVVQHACPQ
jgi:hypothetical protein